MKFQILPTQMCIKMDKIVFYQSQIESYKFGAPLDSYGYFCYDTVITSANILRDFH